MEYSSHKIVRIVQKVDSFFDRMSKIFFVIAGILVVCITLLIFAGVFNRSFIGKVWLFVEDYAELSLIPMSYLVYGYVLRQDRHLNMDLIYNKFGHKGRTLLSVFCGLFSLFIACFMLKYSFSYMMYQYDHHIVSSSAMKVTLWPFSLCIVIGMTFFVIDVIFYTLDKLFYLIYGEQPLKFKNKIDYSKKEKQKLGISDEEEIKDAELKMALEQQRLENDNKMGTSAGREK